jgi:hypothetical protein
MGSERLAHRDSTPAQGSQTALHSREIADFDHRPQARRLRPLRPAHVLPFLGYYRRCCRSWTLPSREIAVFDHRPHARRLQRPRPAQALPLPGYYWQCCSVEMASPGAGSDALRNPAPHIGTPSRICLAGGAVSWQSAPTWRANSAKTGRFCCKSDRLREGEARCHGDWKRREPFAATVPVRRSGSRSLG